MLVEGKLAVIDHLAGVMIVQHGFAAGRDPFHRAAKLARRPDHEAVLGEEAALQAEAAADVGRHHADAVLRDVEDVRDLHARAVRVLVGAVERGLVGREGVVADADARLHRDGRQAVVLDPELDDVLGAGEGRVGRLLVAEHQAEGVVAGRIVVPHLGRVGLGGVLDIDHSRQRLVVDLDQFRGVAGLRQRLGDDEGDAVADVADAVVDDERLEGAVALGRAEILRHQMRGECADLLGDHVGAGQHQQHAGRGLGLGDVDLLDLGVGVRRQHVAGVQHAGQHDVVDIAALPCQEALVLDPAHRLPDSEFGHGFTPDDDGLLMRMLVDPAAFAPAP